MKLTFPRWFSELRACFAAWQAASPDQLPRTRVEVEMPPVAPPKAVPLSCFVQGIIKSLETEPDRWVTDFTCARRGWCVRHETLNLTLETVSIWMSPSQPENRYCVVHDHPIMPAEQAAIYEVLNRNVLGPLWAESKRQTAQLQTAHAMEVAARKAAFEKLGCPTPSSSPDKRYLDMGGPGYFGD